MNHRLVFLLAASCFLITGCAVESEKEQAKQGSPSLLASNVDTGSSKSNDDSSREELAKLRSQLEAKSKELDAAKKTLQDLQATVESKDEEAARLQKTIADETAKLHGIVESFEKLATASSAASTETNKPKDADNKSKAVSDTLTTGSEAKQVRKSEKTVANKPAIKETSTDQKKVLGPQIPDSLKKK